MGEKNTMKAMVLEEYNKPLVLREIPIPIPGPGQVLIKTMYNGICFTDVKIQKGLMKGMVGALPRIMGHEISGEVVELGSGASRFKVGDKVCCFIYDACCECAFCRRNMPPLCDNLKGMIGTSTNGGYAEYVVQGETAVVPVPEGVPMEYAAVATDAVATCVHALCERIELQEGDTIVVMGVGGLGGNAVQIAKALGATVFAADIDDKKLEAAKEIGADYVFNTTKCDLAEEVKKITNGLDVDYSADFVGHPAATEAALACLGKGGIQVQPGYTPGENYRVPYFDFVSRQASVLASRASTVPSVKKSLELIQTGKVVPQIDQTAVLPLERVNEILERLSEGKVAGRGLIKYC